MSSPFLFPAPASTREAYCHQYAQVQLIAYVGYLNEKKIDSSTIWAWKLLFSPPAKIGQTEKDARPKRKANNGVLYLWQSYWTESNKPAWNNLFSIQCSRQKEDCYDIALPVFGRVTGRAANSSSGKYWASAYCPCIFISPEMDIFTINNRTAKQACLFKCQKTSKRC